MSSDEPHPNRSRRTFMMSFAAAGATAGLAGAASAAQEDEEPAEAERIVLSGPSHGWIGMEPEDIAQQINPTLELEAGQQYEVVWTNTDGVAHNFVILSADGEQILRSPIIEAPGIEQTVEFEATEEMSEYFCEVHPDTMRGDIVVDGEPAEPEAPETVDDLPVAGNFPEGEWIGLQKVAQDLPAVTSMEYIEGDEEDRHFVVTQTGQIYAHRPQDQEMDDPDEDGDENADGDVDENADDDVDEDADNLEFVFDGETRAWIGREPAAIEGEENPTLELVAGDQYTFTWENVDGAPHNIAFRDDDGEHVADTEIIDEEGETQSLEFEATEAMVDYYCEVHPSTMVGDVELVDESPYEEVEEEPEEAPEEEPEDADEVEDETESEESAPHVATPDDMELFLDISQQMVDIGSEELGGYDERGLLGLAFHPDYQENGRFYVRYSAQHREGTPDDYDHTDVLAEFETGDDGTADPESERVILEVPQPQDNHNGGKVAFGPDGYLYSAYGDGGNVHDIGLGHVDDWYDENEGGNGQDTEENLLGGIIRIDVDAENGAYGIPDDNPLVGEEGQREEYYAWGFRNPWGMSVQDDGTVFVTDAGQHLIESAYIVEKGGNYSWNVKEGSFCFSPDSPVEPPEECPDETPEDVRGGEPLRDPIAEYRHKRGTEAFIDSAVVVGGFRYDGEAIPELQDKYVFANWSSEGVVAADGELLSVTPSGDANDTDAEGDEDGTNQNEDDDETANSDDAEAVGVHPDPWMLEELQVENADRQSVNRYIYNVVRDEEGELYVLTNTDYRPFPETGEIYKIVPAEEGEVVAEPEEARTVEDAGDPGEEAEEDEEPEEEENDEEPADDGED